MKRYSRNDVIAVSLTKAAAHEIAGRNVNIPKNRLCTLHSLCYRAIGGNIDVAESKTSEWNEYCAEENRYNLQLSSGMKVDVDDPYDDHRGSETEGDKLLQTMDVYRARMIPQERWITPVKKFADMWKTWKEESDVIDFTDMIEIALEEIHMPPLFPKVFLADEVQDSSKLELALMRKWGKKVERFVIVADPDQSIYGFRGAKPEAFFNPEIPERQYITLRQSHRVPKKIHGYAMRWINQIPDRKQVDYLPTDKEGEISCLPANFKNPTPLLFDLEDKLKAEKSVMILATCEYMLNDIIRALKNAGIPFHNEYRKKNGRWNPIRFGSEKRTTTIDRILAYLRANEEIEGWTGEDVKKFSEHLEAKKVFKYGMKSQLSELNDIPYIDLDELFHYFEEDEIVKAYFDALDGEKTGYELPWFKNSLLKSKRGQYDYPFQILSSLGIGGIKKKPLITVGTGHSVKGGEADVVYVYPDVSYSAKRAMDRDPEATSEMIRLFYVMFTRAREELVLCEPQRHYSVNLFI